MKKDDVIILADDDEGHAELIRKNLIRTGIENELLHFKDGQETMDFLLQKRDEAQQETAVGYVLLLDIRMPKLDGIEVLMQIKSDPKLSKTPVIMVTTTDDPKEIERCYNLGSCNYFVKPVGYESFVETIQQLSLFLADVEAPVIV